MKIWDIPIVDFVSIQDDTDDSDQLIVLTVAEKGAETTTLMLLSFPGMENKIFFASFERKFSFLLLIFSIYQRFRV